MTLFCFPVLHSQSDGGRLGYPWLLMASCYLLSPSWPEVSKRGSSNLPINLVQCSWLAFRTHYYPGHPDVGPQIYLSTELASKIVQVGSRMSRYSYVPFRRYSQRVNLAETCGNDPTQIQCTEYNKWANSKQQKSTATTTTTTKKKQQ